MSLRPSYTSVFVTWVRACGHLVGGCDDHLAIHMLGTAESIHAVGVAFLSLAFPSFVVSRDLCGRCNYGDDAIRKATKEGIKQIVILGAGNDTRLHRLPNLPEALFEVDAPATQKSKLNALKSFRNNKVRFVTANFETESWLQKLVEAGFDPKQKSVIIWEGISYYLTASAIEQTLESVSKCEKGTKLVFDYAQYKTYATVTMARIGKIAEKVFQAGAKAIGEPWLTVFRDYQLDVMVKDFGLTFETYPLLARTAIKAKLSNRSENAFDLWLATVTVN